MDVHLCTCSAMYLCQKEKKYSRRNIKCFKCTYIHTVHTSAIHKIFSTHIRFLQYGASCLFSVATYHNYGNIMEFLFAPVTLNTTITYIPVIAQFYLNNLHGAILARPECSSGYQRAAILSYVCLSTHASKPRLSMRQQWLQSAL